MIFKSINARSKDARLYDIAFGAMTNKVYADGNGKKGQALLYNERVERGLL